MKKTIIYLLILLIWIGTGCQVTRKLEKERKKNHTERNSTTDSASREVTREQANILTTETITTTERTDTTIKVPGSMIETGTRIADFMRTGELVTETGDMTLRIFTDSLTGTIRAQATARPREVRINTNRTRTEQRTINADTDKDRDARVDVSRTNKERVQTFSETMKKETKRLPWFVYAGIAVAAIALLVFIYLKRFKILAFFNRGK